MQSLKQLAAKKLPIRDARHLPDDVILELAEENLKPAWIIKASSINTEEENILSTYDVIVFVTKANNRYEAIDNFIRKYKNHHPVDTKSIIYDLLIENRRRLSKKFSKILEKYSENMDGDEYNENSFIKFVDDNYDDIHELLLMIEDDKVHVTRFAFETKY